MFNNNNIGAKLNNIQTNNRNINHINDFVSYINDVKLEKVNELASSLMESENLFFVEAGRNT